MDCSQCGKPIDLDLMRCQACGHDMLPQDISRGPFTGGARTATSERPFADAIRTVQVGLHEVATIEDRADRARRMRRVYWRVAALLATIIGLGFLLSIL